MNELVICGRIGKDPEIKYFESGTVKTTFSIASSRWDSQNKKEVTDWYNIECWSKLAEIVAEHFKKGNQIIVDGEFKKETYKGKDGKEKTNYKVIARNVKYSNAYLTISGMVENVENKFTQSNKKIQTITLKDNPIQVINTNDKIEVISSQFITALCSLAIKDYQSIAKALKIDVNSLKNTTDYKGNKPIVKFGEVEEINDEEIPF